MLTVAPKGWSCLCHVCSGCCWCQEGLGLSSTWSCIPGKATHRKLSLWSPSLQSLGPSTLFTASKFNYPSPCPPPVHSRENKTLSGWHWNVTGCAELSPACWSLLPPAGPHSSAPPWILWTPPAQASNSSAKIHQNQNANSLCNNIMSCQEETLWA